MSVSESLIKYLDILNKYCDTKLALNPSNQFYFTSLIE